MSHSVDSAKTLVWIACLPNVDRMFLVQINILPLFAQSYTVIANRSDKQELPFHQLEIPVQIFALHAPAVRFELEMAQQCERISAESYGWYCSSPAVLNLIRSVAIAFSIQTAHLGIHGKVSQIHGTCCSYRQSNLYENCAVWIPSNWNVLRFQTILSCIWGSPAW